MQIVALVSKSCLSRRPDGGGLDCGVPGRAGQDRMELGGVGIKDHQFLS